MAITALLCCGVAWLLVSAGVIAVSGGLLSSPELTVAAVALAGWATVRLAGKAREATRPQEPSRKQTA